MNNLYNLTIKEALDNLKIEEITCEELVRSVCARIESVDGKINAVLARNFEQAIEEAKEKDKRIQKGEDIGPLGGIPVLVKDSILTEGIKTTCSSKILENFVPTEDATAVKKLKEAGAIVIGKTNLDEFAMGSSTENSAFGATKNPFDLARVPGGSSGGSAAAVAANECIFAIGSDTGGSIRQPASFCGCVGLKPTYGSVSRYGLVAMASSLDQIGPLTKNVYDCALVASVLSGKDSKDATSMKQEAVNYLDFLERGIKGMKVGIIKELFGDGIAEDVKEKIQESIDKLKEAGVEVEEVSLPNIDYSLAVYYIIMPAEVSSNLARFDGIRYGASEEGSNLLEVYQKTKSKNFGEEVKRRIMLGTYVLSHGYYDAYYLKAQKVRKLIQEDFKKAFEKYDLLLSPSTPTTAFKIGEKTADPLQMYLSDICTVPINLAGVPAISIPAGLTKEGLPVGLQLIAPHFKEERLFQAAYVLEQMLEMVKCDKI